MPEKGETFTVPAADNDPCFAGKATAVIEKDPDPQSCTFTDRSHFWQQASTAAAVAVTVVAAAPLLAALA